MKIVKTDSSTVNFKSLMPGQVFTAQGSGAFMKTVELEDDNLNTVDLDDGSLTSFSPSAQVVHYPVAALHLTPSTK